MTWSRTAPAIALAVLCAIAAWPPAAHAQPPAAPPSGGPPPAPPWWMRGWLSDPAAPTRFQIHVEGTASIMEAKGNSDGYAFDGHAGLVLRKRRITYRFDADLSKRDIVYGLGGGAATFTMHTIRNQVDFDLTKRATIVAGIEVYENTLMFLTDRHTEYVGGGLSIVDTPHHRLQLLGGVGHVGFIFDRETLEKIAPVAVAALPTLEPTSPAVLGIEMWSITLPGGKVTLSQDGSYRDYFKDELGRLWTFNVMLNVPIGTHVSIVPAYGIKEEQNVYTDAFGVKPQDRTLTMGVRVSF